jgi:hypothetical protein
VKKWPFPEEAPPADLDEAYTKYTLRMQFSEDRLRVFKEAVRQTLGENLVTIGELNLLDRLALDLGVKEPEQNRILKEISREAPEFFDPQYQGSLRDRLHLIGYRGELERALSENNGVLPHAAALAEMQTRYCVQPAEHDDVMSELRDPQGPRAAHLRREVAELQQTRREAAVLAAYSAPSIHFLLRELERGIESDLDHVLQMANLYGPAGELDALRGALRQTDADPTTREQVADWLRQHLPAPLAEAVVEAVCVLNPPAEVDTRPAVFTRKRICMDAPPPCIRSGWSWGPEVRTRRRGMRKTGGRRASVWKPPCKTPTASCWRPPWPCSRLTLPASSGRLCYRMPRSRSAARLSIGFPDRCRRRCRSSWRTPATIVTNGSVWRRWPWATRSSRVCGTANRCRT